MPTKICKGSVLIATAPKHKKNHSKGGVGSKVQGFPMGIAWGSLFFTRSLGKSWDFQTAKVVLDLNCLIYDRHGTSPV